MISTKLDFNPELKFLVKRTYSFARSSELNQLDSRPEFWGPGNSQGRSFSLN